MTKSEVIASIGTRDWARVKTSGGSTIAALENAGVAFVAGNGGWREFQESSRAASSSKPEKGD
jgi:hypothetical protein